MKPRHTLFRACLILLAAWLGLTGLAALFYPRLLYHPNRNLSDVTPTQAGAAGFDEVWLTAADGVKLHAWFVRGVPERGRAKTLLVFHGNAGNLETASPRLALYSRLGYDAFMVDYHGFGRSGGEPEESNLYLDADAAWKYLTEDRGIAPGNIVIVGYSLGGAVASRLASRQPAAGLVLESTFTSLADIASDLFPYLPAGLVVGRAFDTLSRLDAIRMPLLVVHGRGDRLVPFSHGEKLYESFSGAKAFLVIGDDHNFGFLARGDIYGKGIGRFIENLRQNE